MTSPKALKGRQTTAQGKEPSDAALGSPPPQEQSPERATRMPMGWVCVELAEIAETSSGGTPSRTIPENYNGTIPWIKSGNLKDGTVNESDEFISDLALKNSAAKLFPAGALLIALYGATIGKLGILTIQAATNQAVCGIFLSQHVSRQFLFSFLIFHRRKLIELGQGGAQPNISQQIVRSIQIPLPPLAEQRRIVAKIEELFSELDAGEESLRRARRQLGVYRQSLLKQAFEGKLTAPWRKQTPHLLESPDQLLARIQGERQARYEEELKVWEAAVKQREKAGDEDKRPSKPKCPAPPTRIHLGGDDDLYDLPDSWAWLSFDSACYESVLGKMLDNAKNRGEPKPYLRNINVRWGRFDLSDLFDIRIEKSEIGRYRAEAGDLIICEGGEPGRCAVWPTNERREVFLQKALHRVRFTDGVSPYFVQLLMSLTASTKRLEKYFTGTTIKHLTGTGLSGVPIPLCSLPEQQEIVRLLDEQFTVIEQNEREIDAALQRSAALRQSILKKAFTGQLVPQDPTDEPTSTLLERIREERTVGAKILGKKAARRSLPI